MQRYKDHYYDPFQRENNRDDMYGIIVCFGTNVWDERRIYEGVIEKLKLPVNDAKFLKRYICIVSLQEIEYFYLNHISILAELRKRSVAENLYSYQLDPRQYSSQMSSAEILDFWRKVKQEGKRLLEEICRESMDPN